MNWLIDRDYISQEIYGGVAVPKWFSLVSGFPDYARMIDAIRPLEVKYSFDREKAVAVIDEEMVALGAEKVDGKWTFEGEPVELIFLIRTDSDGTRRPMGDIISNWMEEIGFTVDRQYKTSSEASPIWVLGNPQDGLWHMYTGAWGVGGIPRDDGSDFQFFNTQQSGYAFSPLWQAYNYSEEDLAVSEALANKTFATLEERRELFAQALEDTFKYSYHIWVVDGKGASTWRPGLTVSYDLAAGVDINTLWPYTLRLVGEEGGLVRWADPDLFVDPANPVAGSNWTYDSQWQIATSDWDAIPNPYTGVPLPQRLERAEVTIETGLPVGKTYDWVSLEFADTIEVPGDVWVDWDVENEVFITADEKFPDGLTAKRKVVHYYPAELWDITWHDGSPMSVGDFVMSMIMTFAPGTEGSPIFDESQAPVLESFLSTFKGFKIVSTDPLVFELYSDTWYFDAEINAVVYRSAFWPEYGYGQAGWPMMAVANKAEAAGELAYSADKSDALEVEWMNFIGGPSLEILAAKLDEAIAENHIPFEPTMSQFVTAEEAAARYANLQAFYNDHGHFWVGTGPYVLDEVYLVEKTLTLTHNPNYPDLADKWALFSSPRLATTAVDGPGRVVAGEEAVFDVFVTDAGDPYASADVAEVKYLLFDANNELVATGLAELVDEGYYTVTLDADTTGALESGATKLEVVTVVIPVAIPSIGAYEFVTE
jgi:peptide/nickel transport system substrate-binding protein